MSGASPAITPLRDGSATAGRLPSCVGGAGMNASVDAHSRSSSEGTAIGPVSTALPLLACCGHSARIRSASAGPTGREEDMAYLMTHFWPGGTEEQYRTN